MESVLSVKKCKQKPNQMGNKSKGDKWACFRFGLAQQCLLHMNNGDSSVNILGNASIAPFMCVQLENEPGAFCILSKHTCNCLSKTWLSYITQAGLELMSSCFQLQTVGDMLQHTQNMELLIIYLWFSFSWTIFWDFLKDICVALKFCKYMSIETKFHHFPSSLSSLQAFPEALPKPLLL